MKQTVLEKITQAHAVGLDADQLVRAGDYVTVRPSVVMTQDKNTKGRKLNLAGRLILAG
jgi:hypothetical protein